MPVLNKDYIMKNNNQYNDNMYLYNATQIQLVYFIFLITRQQSNFQSFNDYPFEVAVDTM